MRPCQNKNRQDIPESAVPTHDICKTDKEIVYVIEDDEDLRSNIVEILEYQGYECRGLPSFLTLQESLQQCKSGCVILDIRLPGQDGTEIQEWLIKSDIKLPIIFVSGTQDIATIIHCLKAGAIEFLPKPFSDIALRRAVSTALGISRKRYCLEQSRLLVSKMINSLTPTEKYVAHLIAKGYATKVIAAQMSRSENTVKIHRHRIFTKMMVNSTASVANIIRLHNSNGGSDIAIK